MARSLGGVYGPVFGGVHGPVFGGVHGPVSAAKIYEETIPDCLVALSFAKGGRNLLFSPPCEKEGLRNGQRVGDWRGQRYF